MKGCTYSFNKKEHSVVILNVYKLGEEVHINIGRCQYLCDNGMVCEEKRR